MKKLGRSIANKILLISSLVLIAVVGIILVVMSYSMVTLTDSMMLNVTQVTARTTAQNISENLNHIAERLYLTRADRNITSAVATEEDMNSFIETTLRALDFVWLGLYDAQGKVITGSANSPQNIQERSIFPKVLKSNDLSVENTTMGSSDLEIVMGLPIHREWLASFYLVGSQRYDILSETLRNISIGDNSIAFIIDDNKSLVAHSRNTEKIAVNGDIVAGLGGGAEIEQVISMMLLRMEGSQIVFSANNPMYISYVPIQGTPWSLGIVALRSDFTGAFNAALIRSIFLGFIILSVSLLSFRFLLSRTITGPLRKITESAALMARGQFNSDALLGISDRSDEIGQLGTGFNTVSNSIHQVIKDISQLTQQASRGALGTRADAGKHEGNFYQIMSEINAVIAAFCSHLDAIPDAFALLNEKGEIIFQNTSLKNLFLRHSSCTGSSAWLAKLVTSEQSEELPSKVRELFTGDNDEETFFADIMIANKSEEKSASYYSLTLKRVEVKQTIVGGAGNFFYVILLLTDTTQLTETKIAAEVASHAKSEFLSNMSHEIRTPMNAIIGIAQIELQKEKMPDEYRLALEKIYSSGILLLGIVNDILDLSKIETGKMELVPKDYDLPSLINDTVQLNIVRIGSKPLEFILDVDENLPARLFGDELRIKQILNNLLSNAVKYSEKGYVKLSVSHLAQDTDVMLRFSVEDTGFGIKKEDYEKLFIKYSRLAADRNIEGTGIGLSIARKFAEMMNGSIEVESEYGKGSKFTVTIKQKAAASEIIGAELSKQLRSFSFTREKQYAKQLLVREFMPYGKVLIVDDMESNLYVAEGLMSSYKLTIETAGSGFAAIEKIKEGKVYDVIFMDHMMPLMDGIKTTKKLREMGYSEIIVALTANALIGNKEMFMQNGFDGFISKPIDIKSLNLVLNKFVRDKYPEEAAKYKQIPAAVQAQASAITPRLLEMFRRDTEKAIITLKETVLSGKLRCHSDLLLFTTTVHAMKSALANIGENENSSLAAALEEAGRKNDSGFIFSNTEKFITILELLVKNLRPAETALVDDADIQENTEYLKKQLLIIKTACEQFDDTAVYAALDLLKEKSWKKEISIALENIRDILFLDSDFEKAAEQAAAMHRILS
ncbi:MAG: ATP-binding protein [Spirochaetes bacterium]|nr:ATP-binding protein [Spirochaetota bacterium]